MTFIITTGIVIAGVVLVTWLSVRFWAKQPFWSSVLAAGAVLAYVLALTAIFLLFVPLARWGVPDLHEEGPGTSTGILVALSVAAGGIPPAAVGFVLLVIGLIVDLLMSKRSKPSKDERPAGPGE